MRLRNLFTGILVVFSILILVACSDGNSTGGDSKTGDKSIQIASGGTSGTYFPIAVAMAKVINDNTEFNSEAQTTGGSIANIRMIGEGEVEMAFSGSITGDAGYTGVEPFEEAIDNIKSIASLYPETLQIIVPANSDINSIEDLSGKKVAVGAPGSGTERVAKIILDIYGIPYEDISPEFLNFSEAVTSMKDSTIDAAFIMAGTPTSAVVDAATSLDVRILEFEENMVETIIEQEPFLIKEIIDANTYEGIDKDIVTLATPATIIIKEDMDEDEVYEITKAIFENVGDIQESHAQAKNITLESAIKGLSIPLHPGAKKYYTEQGLDIEDLE